MPDARTWSERIAAWAVQDRAEGERVYLSVDRAVLEEIGMDLGGFDGSSKRCDGKSASPVNEDGQMPPA